LSGEPITEVLNRALGGDRAALATVKRDWRKARAFLFDQMQ